MSNSNNSTRNTKLRTASNQVKNETRDDANTADRIGGLFLDMVDFDISDAGDVEIKNPTADQGLIYSNGKWRNSAIPGGGGGGGGTAGKQETFFLNITHNVVPDLPAVSEYNSATQTFVHGTQVWSKTNANPGENEDTYMIWSWFVDASPQSVSGPVRIYNSASGGSNGEDANETEWVYRRVSIRPIAEVLAQWTTDLENAKGTNGTGGKNYTVADVIPPDWTDNAQGIDSTNKYEYASFRVSTIDANGKRKWGDTGFSEPILWSAFGERGTDGDGVEYIYYVNSGDTPTSYLDPSTWDENTKGEGGKTFQDDEFIAVNSGWTDEPSTLQPGQTQWSSVRKKKIPADSSDGKTAKWQTYSEPVIWGRYALDGVAEGYVVTLGNSTMIVGTDSEGNADGYSNICSVSVEHNGLPMTYTSYESSTYLDPDEFGFSIGTITIDGATVGNTITATKSNSSVQVSVNNITNFALKNAVIPITIYLPGDKGTREFAINLNGIPSEAGMLIDMYISSVTVKEDYYHQNVYPATIDVGVRIGKGTDIKLYKVGTDDTELANMGYTFFYFYNGDSSNQVQVTYPFEPEKSTSSVERQTITFIMKLNGKTIDAQNVNYIHEPAPPIGTNSYDINVTETSVYKDSDGNVSGQLVYQVTKTVSGTTWWLIKSDSSLYWTTDVSNPTDKVLADETMNVFIAECEVDYTGGTSGEFTAGLGAGDTPGEAMFSQIILYSAAHMPLRSIVIPMIVQGQKGESTTQAINGTVIRFRNWETLTTDGYGNVAIGALASSDGVIYKDVIVYEGEYFYIAPSYSGSLSPDVIHATGNEPMDSSGNVRAMYQHIPMVGDAAFQTLLAKYAYIENLTASEIVITDATTQKPVAGMTRGSGVNIYPEGEDPLADITRGSVRIWAGYSDATADLTNSKFYVTEGGFLHAENADITGKVVATSGSFKGTMTTLDETVNVFSSGLGYGSNRGLEVKTNKERRTTASLTSTEINDYVGGSLVVHEVDSDDNIRMTASVDPRRMEVRDSNGNNGVAIGYWEEYKGGQIAVTDGSGNITINMQGTEGILQCGSIEGRGANPIAVPRNININGNVTLPNDPAYGAFVFGLFCNKVTSTKPVRLHTGTVEDCTEGYSFTHSAPMIFVYDGTYWQAFYCGG